MKSAQQINDSFRKEIRNRQKQQLFQSIRSHYAQQMHSSQPNLGLRATDERNLASERMTNINMVPNAREDEENKRLNFICSELELHKHSLSKCIKILDQNIHHQLISNLQRGLSIESSLTLISAIIRHEKLKVASKYVNGGLIEHLLLQVDKAVHIRVCMEIIANLIFQNVEYAEILLENKVHIQLINLMDTISNKDNALNQVEVHQTGFSIMFALAALLEVENAEPYHDSFLQILQFALQVHRKQLYPNIIIDIMFLVGYSFRKETQDRCSHVINQMLNEVSAKTQHVEHLLILIKLLSPIDIDYSGICSLAVMGEGKAPSYCVRIMERVLNARENISSTPLVLPTNIEWWERFYLKFVKVQDIQLFVVVLTKSQIKSQFVYRLLFDVLDKHSKSSITLINEVLICLNSLLSKHKTHEQYRKLKFCLKTTGINQQLERLLEHRNKSISEKSLYLLNSIAFMDTAAKC